MGCSVGFKYTKNVLVAGTLPRTPLAELDSTLPQTSYSWADGRGKGRMASPQTMDKKLKLSCCVTHIDVLAVAVINGHNQLINIAGLPHFRHITSQKKLSPSGDFAP